MLTRPVKIGLKTGLYLISPAELVLKEFRPKLEEALSTAKITVFQLRLKALPKERISEIARDLLELCRLYKAKFIIDDHLDIALKIGADGVHLGVEDQNLTDISPGEIPGGFIIGVSCYGSKQRAELAVRQGASYISFGTFFLSPTKNSGSRPAPEIIEWSHQNYPDIPVVAIGGINNQNCPELIRAGADFLAVISFVWQHKQGPKAAIYALSESINSLSVI